MKELTKKQKKHFRELIGVAYERHLSRCMEELHGKFALWNDKKISVWELNEEIQQFHDGRGKELYKSYNGVNLVFAVAYGVKEGVLSLEEIEEDSRERVKVLVDLRKDEKGRKKKG